MKKAVHFFLILLGLSVIGILIKKDENNLTANNEVKLCSELNYEQGLLNHRDKFGKFDLHIKILKERKWKKILIKNQLAAIENGSFNYPSKYIPITLVVSNKYGLKCKLSAEIKPHGDMMDHFVDFKSGYHKIYELPSLKVKILDGNIFGVVEFRLFVPKTRNYSNEVFATTLFNQLGMYAPITTYVDVNYNNKQIKFIFQEKINKEFLENNSLQEGLIFSGDERFIFKYNEVDAYKGETGISKHKLHDSKILKNSLINQNMAIKALEILNQNNYFYETKLNQGIVIDYYSSEKNRNQNSLFFSNLPKFDALMTSIGGWHGLSRDDRRLYFSSYNKFFLPIYYDGNVSIFNEKNEIKPNNTDFNLSLNQFDITGGKAVTNVNKIINSAKIGSIAALKSIDMINVDNLNLLLEDRGLGISIDNLNKVILMIKKNLILMSQMPSNQIINPSNSIRYPIKNNLAVSKNIDASYIFIKDNNFIKCDLLIIKCLPIVLNEKEIRLVLEQKLKNNTNELIFMGDLDIYKKKGINSSQNYKVVNISKNFNIKLYGDINININEKEKIINLKKNSTNSRILISDSFISDWNFQFEDLSNSEGFIKRDINGLSGCLNFYDSNIQNIELSINKGICEDGINFVRTKGIIKKVSIIDTSYDGIDSDFSSIEFKELMIENAGNDCVDFSYGNYVMKNSYLADCGDKAISVGEKSNLLLEDFQILKAKIGIASKDSSSVELSNGMIDTTEQCVSLYNKKQEFNGAYMKIKNLICENYNSFSKLDEFSKIIYY